MLAKAATGTSLFPGDKDRGIFLRQLKDAWGRRYWAYELKGELVVAAGTVDGAEGPDDLHRRPAKFTIGKMPEGLVSLVEQTLPPKTRLYPRGVVKAALAHNAAAVIFAHNHLSGVAEPSIQDQALTRTLAEALALVDIKVLDHVIVAPGASLSFAARGPL